jgi:hypothetical protein
MPKYIISYEKRNVQFELYNLLLYVKMNDCCRRKTIAATAAATATASLDICNKHHYHTIFSSFLLVMNCLKIGHINEIGSSFSLTHTHCFDVFFSL